MSPLHETYFVGKNSKLEKKYNKEFSMINHVLKAALIGGWRIDFIS